MSQKRRRRDRRQEQITRAIEHGDTAEMWAAFTRTPESAHSSLIAALAAPPADPSRAAELAALAAGMARQLRLAGKPADALGVTRAAQRRTEALRMEEALAAFALGQDEAATAVADEDPVVAAALRPLLRAVQGELPLPASELTPRASRPLHALHRAAEAVAWTLREEPNRAQEILASIEPPLQEEVLARELSAAASLSGSPSDQGSFSTLIEAPVVKQSTALQTTVIQEAPASAVKLPFSVLQGLPDGPVVRRLLRIAEMGEAKATGTTAEIVRRIGASAFEESQRATADLYEGFALLPHDLRAAHRSFDHAIELGGDLTEALRGKLVAASKAMALSQPGSEERQKAAHLAASMAERLLRVLQREPESRPLAAVAAAFAAKCSVEAEDPKAALAAVKEARGLATGKLLAELDLTEAYALALDNPKAARAQVDALLSRDPTQTELWRLKLELSEQAGDKEKKIHEIVLAAAEATKDPAFVAEAHRAAAKKPSRRPFAELVRGSASAGAVARELSRIAFEERESRRGIVKQAAPYREALDPAGRLAVDTAVIVFKLAALDDEEARAHLVAAAETWQSVPGDLTRLLAASLCVDVGLADAIVDITRILKGNIPALMAFTEMFIAAGMGARAAEVLQHFAPRLPVSERSRLQSLAKQSRHHVIELPGVPNPAEALKEIDRTLAPDFSLIEFVRECDREQDDLSFVEIPPADDLEALFKALISIAGEMPFTLPPAKIRALERKLQKLVSQGPSKTTLKELLEVLKELGVPAEALLELGAMPPSQSREAPRRLQ